MTDKPATSTSHEPEPAAHRASPPEPRANKLLAHMTPAGRFAMLKGLKPIALASGDVLYEPNSVMRQVYFPVDCLVSLLAPMKDHLSVEVAVVGSEGMIGVPLALGEQTSLVQAIVQGSGSAFRLSARAFHAALVRDPQLRKAVNRYLHSLVAQLTQSAACNAFHPVEARCARWLSAARDRLIVDELDLTHEALAQMLGVRRVGITVAAGNLQRRGIIRYSRGRMVVVDRHRLALAACECYGIVKKEYELA